MLIAWLVCYYRNVTNVWKIVVTLLPGYMAGVICVWVYWEFAGTYAPTEAIAEEILSKDGAPQLLAPFVMPFFVGIYFAMMWPFAWIVTRLFPGTVAAEVVEEGEVPA